MSWSDSDRNIIASLAHEACEFHCDVCDACLTESELDAVYGWCDDCASDADDPADKPLTSLEIGAERAEAMGRGDRI